MSELGTILSKNLPQLNSNQNTEPANVSAGANDVVMQSEERKGAIETKVQAEQADNSALAAAKKQEEDKKKAEAIAEQKRVREIVQITLTEEVKKKLSAEIDPILNNPEALISYFKNQFPPTKSDWNGLQLPTRVQRLKLRHILCIESYEKIFIELILNNAALFRGAIAVPSDLEYYCTYYPNYAEYFRLHYNLDIELRYNIGACDLPKLPSGYYLPQSEIEVSAEEYYRGKFENKDRAFYEKLANDPTFAELFFSIYELGSVDGSMYGCGDQALFAEFKDKIFAQAMSLDVFFSNPKRFQFLCNRTPEYARHLKEVLEKEFLQNNNVELLARSFGHTSGVDNFKQFSLAFYDPISNDKLSEFRGREDQIPRTVKPEVKAKLEQLANLIVKEPSIILPMVFSEQDCQAFCEMVGTDSKAAAEARAIHKRSRDLFKKIAFHLPKLPVSLDADKTVIAQHTQGTFKRLKIDSIFEKWAQGKDNELQGIDTKLAIEEFEHLEKLFAEWPHLEPFINSQGANKTRLKNVLRAITRKRAVPYTDAEISMRCFGLETLDLLNLHCDPEASEILRKKLAPMWKDPDCMSDVQEISQKLGLNFANVYRVIIQGGFDKLAEDPYYKDFGKIPAIIFRLIALRLMNDNREKIPFIACDDEGEFSGVQLSAIIKKANVLIRHFNSFNALPKIPELDITTIEAMGGSGPQTRNELGIRISGSRFALPLIKNAESITLDIFIQASQALAKDEKLKLTSEDCALLDSYQPFFERRAKLLAKKKIYITERQGVERPNEDNFVAKLLNINALTDDVIEKLKEEWVERSGRRKEEIELIFASFKVINQYAPIFSNEADYSTAKLQSKREALLKQIHGLSHVWSKEHDELLAIDRELMRRKPRLNSTGVGYGAPWNRFPFPNQMLAVLVAAKLPLFGYSGDYANIPEYLTTEINAKHRLFNGMVTGDGKSMVQALQAGLISSIRRKKWVLMMPTDYLCKRDRLEYAPYYTMIGKSCHYDGSEDVDKLPVPVFQSLDIIYTKPGKFAERVADGLANDIRFGSIDEGHLLAYKQFGDRVVKRYVGDSQVPHGPQFYTQLNTSILQNDNIREAVRANGNTITDEMIIKELTAMGFLLARTEAEVRLSEKSPDRELYFPVKGARFEALLKALKEVYSLQYDVDYTEYRVKDNSSTIKIKFMRPDLREAQKYPDHQTMYTNILARRVRYHFRDTPDPQLELGSIPLQTALRHLDFAVLVSGTPGTEAQREMLAKLMGFVFTDVPNNFPRLLEKRQTFYDFHGAWQIAPVQLAIEASQKMPKMPVLYLANEAKAQKIMNAFYRLNLNGTTHLLNVIELGPDELNDLIRQVEKPGTIYICTSQVPVGLDIPANLHVITDELPDDDNDIRQGEGRAARLGRFGIFETHYSRKNLAAKIGLRTLPSPEQLKTETIYDEALKAQRALERARIPLNEKYLVLLQEQNLADMFYKTIPVELSNDDLAAKFDLDENHSLVQASREWAEAYTHLSLLLGAYQLKIYRALTVTDGTKIKITEAEIEAMRQELGKEVANCIYEYWTNVHIDEFLGKPGLTPIDWVQANRAQFDAGVADRLITLLKAKVDHDAKVKSDAKISADIAMSVERKLAADVAADVAMKPERTFHVESKMNAETTLQTQSNFLETKAKSESSLLAHADQEMKAKSESSLLAHADQEMKAKSETSHLAHIEAILKEALDSCGRVLGDPELNNINEEDPNEREIAKDRILTRNRLVLKTVALYKLLASFVSRVPVKSLNTKEQLQLFKIHLKLNQICNACKQNQFAALANLYGVSFERAANLNAHFARRSLYEDVIPSLDGKEKLVERLEFYQFILSSFAESVYDESLDVMMQDRLESFLRDLKENLEFIAGFDVKLLNSLIETLSYLNTHINTEKFTKTFTHPNCFPFMNEFYIAATRKSIIDLGKALTEIIAKRTMEVERTSVSLPVPESKELFEEAVLHGSQSNAMCDVGEAAAPTESAATGSVPQNVEPLLLSQSHKRKAETAFNEILPSPAGVAEAETAGASEAAVAATDGSAVPLAKRERKSN